MRHRELRFGGKEIRSWREEEGKFEQTTRPVEVQKRKMGNKHGRGNEIEWKQYWKKKKGKSYNKKLKWKTITKK